MDWHWMTTWGLLFPAVSPVAPNHIHLHTELISQGKKEMGREGWGARTVLIQAMWGFVVLLAPSARCSWCSHASLQLGLETAGGERRKDCGVVWLEEEGDVLF